MDEALQLRNQVCFALYSASRAVTGVYRQLLDRMDLTYPQFLVMLVLWESDGRTVSELGSALRLDSGTLSPLLKRLAADGLVERRRDPADERRVTVHLTPKAAEMRQEACQIPAQVADAAGLSPAELIALRETLTTIADSIRSTTGKDNT